jgi:putative DNA primase/helicase
MNRATSVRLRLHREGYAPIPLIGKVPNDVGGWQGLEITEDVIRGWEDKYPNHTNTGIRTRGCPVIDIDILNPEGVDVAVNLARSMFADKGVLLFRTGRAPKVATLFRTSKPFKKTAHKYRAPDGTPHQIEILGDGQQMAAFGIHPDTKRPFAWEPYDPTVVGRHELPELTEELAKEFLNECDRRLAARGWIIPRSSKPVVSEWRKPVRLQTKKSISNSIDGVLAKMAGATPYIDCQILAHWGCNRLREKVDENHLEANEAVALAIAAATSAGLSYERAAEVAHRIILR